MEELVSTTILKKRILIPGRVTEMTLDAPEIAAKAKPGNFVILRVKDDGERFPLTIADADAGKGTITIVYLVLGKSTAMLDTLGERLARVVKELGDGLMLWFPDPAGAIGTALALHATLAVAMTVLLLQVLSIEPVNSTHTFLSILPLSHTYENTLGFILPLMQGATVYYLDKPPTAAALLPALKIIKPTHILSVPMVIEKIYKNQ